jgi:hypothetical protein
MEKIIIGILSSALTNLGTFKLRLLASESFESYTASTARARSSKKIILTTTLLFFVLAFLLLYAPGGMRTASAIVGPSIVQETNAGCASCSSLSVSFTKPVITGDLIVVAATVAAVSSGGITDTQSLVYFGGGAGTTSTRLDPGGGISTMIQYAISTSGGPDTITFTGISSPLIDVYIYELSGVNSPAASLSSNTGDGCPVTPCSDSISDASYAFGPGDFVIAIISDENGASPTMTPGVGFTQSHQISGDDFGYVMYSIPAVSSTTTFPTTIPGFGAPPSGGPAGRWLETGQVFTNVALPTPVFPFGSFLAIVAPLAALAVYFATTKFRTKNVAIPTALR